MGAAGQGAESRAGHRARGRKQSSSWGRARRAGSREQSGGWSWGYRAGRRKQSSRWGQGSSCGGCGAPLPTPPNCPLPRRQWHHRLPRVPDHDGAEDEGHRQRGGDPGGLPRLRQGRERLHQRGRAAPRDDEPGREADGRGGGRDDPRGRHRRRRAGQLRRVRADDDGEVRPRRAAGDVLRPPLAVPCPCRSPHPGFLGKLQPAAIKASPRPPRCMPPAPAAGRGLHLACVQLHAPTGPPAAPPLPGAGAGRWGEGKGGSYPRSAARRVFMGGPGSQAGGGQGSPVAPVCTKRLCPYCADGAAVYISPCPAGGPGGGSPGWGGGPGEGGQAVPGAVCPPRPRAALS